VQGLGTQLWGRWWSSIFLQGKHHMSNTHTKEDFMVWKVGGSMQQSNKTATDITMWKHTDNILCQSAVMEAIFFASSWVLFSSVLNIQQSSNSMKNWLYLLNNDHNPCTCCCCHLPLAWQRKSGIFLGHIFMVKKSLMHLFDPKLKQQND
jgi:hypothetical protein